MDTIELQEQLSFLEETPKRLSQLIRDLDHQSLRTKLFDDEFSVLEHICHLRDIEADGYEVRFARILAEDHPRLVDIDEADWPWSAGITSKSWLTPFDLFRRLGPELSLLWRDVCCRSGSHRVN